MRKLNYILPILLLFIFVQCQQPVEQKEEKPNIVLIFIDDFGWNSISCYGNKLVPTPNVDRIAEEGMLFTDSYVMPQCTPTRAALMTGQHTARNRMWHVVARYHFPWAKMKEPPYLENLPHESYTIAEALHDNGYKTALLGKWHLSTWNAMFPNADGYYTTLFQHAKKFFGFDYVDIPKIPEYSHVTDKGVNYLTDEAIQFMTKNKENPFFIYLSHHTIHRKVLAPDDLVQKYLDKGYPATGQFNATYLAAIEHMDNSVGRVLDAIDSLGIEKNTIVMFYSDNGGVAEEFSNAPLRAGKGSAYEGGIRVPFIVRWPGKVGEHKVSHLPILVTDIYPTLLDMAGVQPKKDWILDGESIVPELEGKPMDPNRDLFFYMPLYDFQWGATPAAVLRSGKYKLIKSFGDTYDHIHDVYDPHPKIELYNLEKDTSEQNNLAAEMPDLAKSMEDKLMNWITNEVHAGLPQINPNYDRSKVFQRVNEFNFAPVIEEPIPDVMAKVGKEFRLTILKSNVVDYDQEGLELKVKMADGSPLPDWMTYNGTDWTLFGTAPEKGEWDVVFSAADHAGEQVAQQVKVVVK